MNEKLSDYINRDLIKTIRSQSKLIHNIHPLSFSKIRLVEIYDKDVVFYYPINVYYKDETLINFYRFKLSNSEYINNRSLYYSSNSITKKLTMYISHIKAYFKYYRRTK